MKERRNIIVIILTLVSIISFSFIILKGKDLNGPLIGLVIGNFLLGSILYGAIPFAGIIGMLLFIVKKNLLIFLISFLCQIVPLTLDIYYYDSDVITYRQFFIPFFVYILSIGLVFTRYFIKQNSSN